MDREPMCKIAYPDAGRLLQFVQHPKLGTGDIAGRLDLAKVMTHGTVDQPKLLQNVERQLLMTKPAAARTEPPLQSRTQVSYPPKTFMPI